MECPNCGCEEVVKKMSGPHLGVYCAACDKWLKWEKQPGNENKTSEDYKAEYMKKNRQQRCSLVTYKIYLRKALTNIKQLE